MRTFLLYLLVLGLTSPLFAGDDGQVKQAAAGSGFYLGMSAGIQMSGIKAEDFVGRNYSPLLGLEAGKWFTPLLALQIGYQGQYFHTISDDKKHYYTYFSGEAIFNIPALFQARKPGENWAFCFHAGSGYFYNSDYKRPNICAHLGLSGRYRLSEKLSAGLRFSSIMGWDIYQGDEDILPGLSLGLSYSF